MKLSSEQSTFISNKQGRKTKHSEIEPPSEVSLLESEVGSEQCVENSAISTDSSEDSVVFHDSNREIILQTYSSSFISLS